MRKGVCGRTQNRDFDQGVMINLLKIAIFICGIGAGTIITLIFWGDHRFKIKKLSQKDSDRLRKILFKENDD